MYVLWQDLDDDSDGTHVISAELDFHKEEEANENV